MVYRLIHFLVYFLCMVSTLLERRCLILGLRETKYKLHENCCQFHLFLFFPTLSTIRTPGANNSILVLIFAEHLTKAKWIGLNDFQSEGRVVWLNDTDQVTDHYGVDGSLTTYAFCQQDIFSAVLKQ